MAKETLPKAKYSADESPLEIDGFELPCYVLDNGQRVLSTSGMIKALGMSRGSSAGRGGDRFAKFLQGKAVSSVIDSDLVSVTETPVKFVTKTGSVANGYDAEILQGIVRALAKAYLQGKLHKQQEHIGKKAEKLDDAFSKVGLIALIDEATGYQYDRERKELQKILGAYINDELLPWQKRFPDSFYREIFRLNGWNFTVNGIRKRPGVIGHWTNRLIYEKLPKGVLRELKKKTPRDEKGRRKHKFHQLLTDDIGNPHLQQQLTAVTTIMRLSKDWKDFEKKFNELYGQTAFDFPEQEEITPKLSDFNQKLKQAANYDPKGKSE